MLNKETATEALKAAMAQGSLTQADILEILHEVGDKYPAHAADVYTNDELEIDDKPLYSKSTCGVWVNAWIFVNDQDITT